MKSNLLIYIATTIFLATIMPLCIYGQNHGHIKENPAYIWAEAFSQTKEQVSESAYKGLVTKLSGRVSIHSNPNINRELLNSYKKDIAGNCRQIFTKEKKPDMVCFYTSIETVLTISSTADALKSRRCSLCQSLLLTFCRLTLLCVIFPGQKFYCKVFPNPKPWLTEAGTEK